MLFLTKDIKTLSCWPKKVINEFNPFKVQVVVLVQLLFFPCWIDENDNTLLHIRLQQSRYRSQWAISPSAKYSLRAGSRSSRASLRLTIIYVALSQNYGL